MKLEAAVIPSLLLTVGDVSYTVEFPLTAVIQAEEKTGKSLKSLNEWFNLQAKDVPAVLAAGLSKHHPDIEPGAVQAICDTLNPEALDEVLYALCKLAFPRRMAFIEEHSAKGKTSPNGQGGDLF
jgi:hypothetical protein